MTSKLEETFGLPASDDPMLQELEARYNFTDNPDLCEIASLALQAYKEQMLDIANFDPKFRARNIEVAQTFLVLAKDALAKDEDLKLKAEKQNQDRLKKDKDDIGDRPNEGETFDREKFINELNAAGKK